MCGSKVRLAGLIRETGQHWENGFSLPLMIGGPLVTRLICSEQQEACNTTFPANVFFVFLKSAVQYANAIVPQCECNSQQKDADCARNKQAGTEEGGITELVREGTRYGQRIQSSAKFNTALNEETYTRRNGGWGSRQGGIGSSWMVICACDSTETCVQLWTDWKENDGDD